MNIIKSLFRLSYRFCQSKTIVQSHIPKSINLQDENIAFGHYFPKDWSKEQIIKRLDPGNRAIKQVKMLINRLGQHSGKVVIYFKQSKAMEEFVKKYNQDFINTDDGAQRIVLKPFSVKIKEIDKSLQRSVRISNLDFSLTEPEIRKLAYKFGNVTDIELPLKPDGRNRGYAKVYFQKPSDLRRFAQYADGLPFLGRKLRVQIMRPSDIKTKEEQPQLPKFMMQQNSKLYQQILKKNTSPIN